MAVQRYYKTKAASAAVDNLDLNIPANKTVIITAIDFTAPAQQQAGLKVLVGPTGSPTTVVAAAQGDKFITIPQADGQIVGPMTFRIQLDNSQNSLGAFLGCSVYYEEL